MKTKKIKAFTLIELLTVLIVIGCLVMIALPNLLPLISKAKSTEAQLQLKHISTLEKSYFYMYSKYSNSLTEINFEHSKLTTQGGSANYQIEVVESSSNTFKARATAIADFDGDGVFNVWEVDQDQNIKEVTPD